MTNIKVLAASLPPPEQRAVALVGLMIRMHGGKDGDGLFSGVSRYEALIGRLRLAAERSPDVRSCWDLTVRTMLWSVGPMRHDEAVLDLTRPMDDDADVLGVLADRAPSVVMIARQLVRRERDADVAAAREARDYASAPLSALETDDDASDDASAKPARRAAKGTSVSPDDEIKELF